MKNLIRILFLFHGSFLVAQSGQNVGPIFVIEQELVTKEKVEALASQGRIKTMHNGVTDAVFDRLKQIHGDTLIAKEFIVLLELQSEEASGSQKSNPSLPRAEHPNKKAADRYLLTVGDQAADFTVRMTDGTSIQLSDLKGKVVLLNFWATWCAPCIREFYEMPSKILDVFDQEKFVYLPVARGEEEEVVNKKLEQLNEKGIVFESGLDPDEEIWKKYALGSIPKNFIIDQDGMIRYVSTGNSGSSVDEMRLELQKLLW